MQGFLDQHLLPLLDVLYPDMPQEICVFLCESLSGHARSIQPRRRNHHIAVFSQPNLQHAFFHVLLEITRRRSDRVIRHYFPPNVAADPQGLLANQMRFDAAITASYHLLLRYDQSQIDAFAGWARTQFHHTPRKPEAAVAALHDFYLVPEDAEDAMQTLVGDKEGE